MGGGNLILLLSLVCNIAAAQTEDLDCATDDETSPDPAGKYSYATSSESTNLVVPFNEPLVLNIYYWQVNNSNGVYNPSNEKQHEDGAVQQTIIVKDNN